MKADFKILALPGSMFEPFFNMSAKELEENDAVLIEVDSNPGYPCRVTLEDAKVGEKVVALSFAHHNVNSPYRSSGAIFVRENAKQAVTKVNEIPLMLCHRVLPIRAYNAEAMMLAAQVALIVLWLEHNSLLKFTLRLS